MDTEDGRGLEMWGPWVCPYWAGEVDRVVLGSPGLPWAPWPVSLIAYFPRASFEWFSTTAGCSTQSTNSWRAGGGAGQETESWTSVSSSLKHSESPVIREFLAGSTQGRVDIIEMDGATQTEF